MTILETICFVLMLAFGILGIAIYILKWLKATTIPSIPSNPTPIEASDLGMMGVLVSLFFGMILLVTQHGEIIRILEIIKTILSERLPPL